MFWACRKLSTAVQHVDLWSVTTAAFSAGRHDMYWTRVSHTTDGMDEHLLLFKPLLNHVSEYSTLMKPEHGLL